MEWDKNDILKTISLKTQYYLLFVDENGFNI